MSYIYGERLLHVTAARLSPGLFDTCWRLLHHLLCLVTISIVIIVPNDRMDYEHCTQLSYLLWSLCLVTISMPSDHINA